MKTILPGFVLWFTGLPCSGKTSLAEAIKAEIDELLPAVEHVDGDVIRKVFTRDLGFSKADRYANVERAAFLAGMLSKNGTATLVSLISPYREMRETARKSIPNFVEVFVSCPLEVCEKRDVKGMYAKARRGELQNFTGVDDPYEEPLNPEITLHTDKQPLKVCIDQLFDFLEQKGWVVRNPFRSNPLLTAAFNLAMHSHIGQKRKGGLPYLSHPVAVAKILKQAGGSDDVVAAGLLHDVLEDTGCEIEDITKKTNASVANIVSEVTDRDKTISWKERKKRYLENLEHASKEGLMVACADKIHNMKSLQEGLKEKGAGFTAQFSAGLKPKVENYAEVLRLVKSLAPDLPLIREYEKVLNDFSVYTNA